MKKVITLAVAAVMSYCPLAVAEDVFPTSRAALVELDLSVDKNIHMASGLLENYVQQLMEDTCHDDGNIVMDDVWDVAPGGTQLPDVHYTKNAKKAIRLLAVVEPEDIVTTTNNVLAGIITLAEVNPTKFCNLTAEFVVRAILFSNNPEELATMCLPTGPEGAMQTETVHIDDVQYWLDNGGLNGPCGGQEPPPAH